MVCCVGLSVCSIWLIQLGSGVRVWMVRVTAIAAAVMYPVLASAVRFIGVLLVAGVGGSAMWGWCCGVGRLLRWV